MKHVRILPVVASSIVLTLVGAEPSRALSTDISRQRIAGGGGMRSSGGQYEVSGTVGQPEAGVMSGQAFAVSGGFWFPQVPTDCNNDGGVDLFDYSALEACLSGPSGNAGEPPCLCFDSDADGDVDLEDVGALQRWFSG